MRIAKNIEDIKEGLSRYPVTQIMDRPTPAGRLDSRNWLQKFFWWFVFWKKYDGPFRADKSFVQTRTLGKMPDLMIVGSNVLDILLENMERQNFGNYDLKELKYRGVKVLFSPYTDPDCYLLVEELIK